MIIAPRRRSAFLIAIQNSRSFRACKLEFLIYVGKYRYVKDYTDILVRHHLCASAQTTMQH